MCNCIDKVNTALEKNNIELDIPELIDFATGQTHVSNAVLIRTVKINPRKHSGYTRSLMASYCPFCGEKYERVPANMQIAASAPVEAE